MPEYTTDLPPTVERDAALGRYMDAWSRLEGFIHYVSQEILELGDTDAHIIWPAVQTFQAIKVLDAAAKFKFNETGRKRVTKICERLTRRNARRNYIVHGRWITAVELNLIDPNKPRYGEWRRVYTHIDPDLPISDDGSDLTIPALDKATDHVEEMIEVLDALKRDIPQLLAQPRTPAQ